MIRGYLQLTLAQLRLFVRNRQVIFWSLIFPIFMIVILGLFLGKGPGITLSGIIIDEDSTTASASLIEALGVQKVIVFTSEADREQALIDLQNGERQLVVIIPEGYGRQLEQAAAGDNPNTPHAPADVIVYFDQSNAATSQIGLVMMDRTIDRISKQMTGYNPVVSVTTHPVQSLSLSYIDFLIPGIVAMMIMSNNLNGVAGQIAAWRERGILRRLQSTTLRPSTFIASQITARLLLNGLQAMLVLVIGSLFFGTQVNGSWMLLVLFVVLGTLAFMAIGFIIAGVAKSPESAGPIAGFISFPLMFLGGVFFPIQNMPAVLQPIIELLPIAHLTTALRQIMNIGATLSELWLEALLLGGWIAVSFLIASYVFQWE